MPINMFSSLQPPRKETDTRLIKLHKSCNNSQWIRRPIANAHGGKLAITRFFIIIKQAKKREERFYIDLELITNKIHLADHRMGIFIRLIFVLKKKIEIHKFASLRTFRPCSKKHTFNAWNFCIMFKSFAPCWKCILRTGSTSLLFLSNQEKVECLISSPLHSHSGWNRHSAKREMPDSMAGKFFAWEPLWDDDSCLEQSHFFRHWTSRPP